MRRVFSCANRHKQLYAKSQPCFCSFQNNFFHGSSHLFWLLEVARSVFSFNPDIKILLLKQHFQLSFRKAKHENAFLQHCFFADELLKFLFSILILRLSQKRIFGGILMPRISDITSPKLRSCVCIGYHYLHFLLSQSRCIQEPVKHLWWCIFVVVTISFQPLTNFTKKLDHIS